MSITLKCERKVAVASPDHQHPCGTKLNNSKNTQFNQNLYALFPERRISVLDLGCSGGDFVKTIIDDGNQAVGLEGSDYSKKRRRAAWGEIPRNLFTCDITGKFDIFDGKKRMMFDVVTAWEVLEHIREGDLPVLVANIKRHMKDDGLCILSISSASSISEGVELHQLRKPKAWWVKKFASYGLHDWKECVDYFSAEFVGGSLENATSFHLVLHKGLTKPQSLPPITLRHRAVLLSKYARNWRKWSMTIEAGRRLRGLPPRPDD